MAAAGARKLSPEQEQAICTRYRAGERTSMLATAHDVSHWTVRETLVRRGVSRIACGGTWKRAGQPFREDFFACIDTHEKAYWLGFLHADGCLSKQNQVRLCLDPLEDGRHVTCFLRSLGLNRNAIEYHHLKHPRNRVTFIGVVGSRSMCDDLRALGVVTGARRWPELNPCFESAFCLGLFDGDGSWMRNARRGTFVPSFVAAPDYAQDFADTIRRHTGLIATPKAYHPKVSYVRYANQQAAATLACWLYSKCDIYLPRKRRRVEPWVGAGGHKCPA